MYGAILGDIVGAPYEFEPIKKTDFPLLSDDSMFTDDSVMTIAVADVLLDAGKNPDEKGVKKNLVKSAFCLDEVKMGYAVPIDF